tara:strand:- start:4695 stop:5474 length:780 start_codon:yes stop_codon:yes gene_type:complete
VQFLKYYILLLIRVINSNFFYFRNKKKISKILLSKGVSGVKPFNKNRWHHNLYTFTGVFLFNQKVFIKVSNVPGVLSNENEAYSILGDISVLDKYLIKRIQFFNFKPFDFLVIDFLEGETLSETWMLNNIDNLPILIKIVEEINNLFLIHRDIKLDNFIIHNNQIKIFDFTFMLQTNSETNLKELDLDQKSNLTMLMDLGDELKPSIYRWDDYYSMYMIFNKFFKKNKEKLSEEEFFLIISYIEKCKEKINSNSYSILK